MKYLRAIIGTVVSIALLAIMSVVPAFAGPQSDPSGIKRAIAVKKQHAGNLLATPGVIGTAVGLGADGNPTVLILTEDPEVAGLPTTLNGVPVEIMVTGEIFAIGHHLVTPVDTTQRIDRPVPIGVSTGHPNITAGTIAARVTDGFDVYALSNNHIYADNNPASIDDPVLQPGPFDGGIDPGDAIGTLYDFEPILIDPDPTTPGPYNTIDAAIALSSTDELGNATPEDGYGEPRSRTKMAKVGDRVQKYGRTTRLTEGVVIGINATVSVNTGSGNFAWFINQIVVQSTNGRSISTDPFVDFGDSGSLVVTRGGRHPVGLLFAGTSGGQLGIANEIDQVLTRFGVTIDGGGRPRRR